MTPREKAITTLVNMGVNRDTAENFIDYHIKHRDIWPIFESLALSAIKRGNGVGSKEIGEAIRRGKDLDGKFVRDPYALNNNYPAYYGRMFVAKYPQFRSEFEFREVQGLKRAA